MIVTSIEAYSHREVGLRLHHAYLLPSIKRILGSLGVKSVFEIGFGNGAVANHLSSLGYVVAGIEPSAEGVALVNKHYSHLTNLKQGNVYDPLAKRFGQFDVVLSLEVIEHIYSPREFMASAVSLVKPGGHLILSTPYHGYLKNLAVAIAGRFDHHVNPLWDHGHIKFWSMNTLGSLVKETGLENISITRVGRIPPLAKSMIVVARRPL